ncbi:MAG TPA: hypothetical protein GXX75_05755 [Clostridiales bacterium]|nr:hypothetical protein [Clostridiales bacterium]
MYNFYESGAKPDNVMCCPVCECQNCHLHSVMINQGGEVMEIGGGRVENHKVENLHRGAIVKVIFTCEDGHRFSKVFQFHKGVTFTDDEILSGDINELWRD